MAVTHQQKQTDTHTSGKAGKAPFFANRQASPASDFFNPSTPSQQKKTQGKENQLINSVDVSTCMFIPSQSVGEHIEQADDKGTEINITAKVLGVSGTAVMTGKKGKYNSTSPVEIPLHIPYLSAAEPMLYLSIHNNIVTGEIGTSKNRSGLAGWINQHAESLGWNGIKLPSLNKDFISTFEKGALNLKLDKIPVKIGGFAEAVLNADFKNFNKPIIDVTADIKVKGIADINLHIDNTKGNMQGSAVSKINFKSFDGIAAIIYQPDGNIDITGTVNYHANKLNGSITLIATDRETADNFARDQLKNSSGDPVIPAKVPVAKPGKERALAGMGLVTFNLTDWFAGSAMVVVDAAGHVTVVGKINPPAEIELFPQKTLSDRTLFKLEVKAPYGIPFIGDVFLFANVSLFTKTIVGPAKLYDILIDGTYSTDPDISNNFSLSASLNISAYTGLGLHAEGGAGMEILQHAIKAGIGISAEAGIQAYVDARPTIGYRNPGQFYFKGHMDIAAMLDLQLSGDLFVELDSPWWSPVPDNKWIWPMASLQYPLNDSFGIGADLDYVLGSHKLPEISFEKVDFDGAKFMTDLVDKKAPHSNGKSKADKKGSFTPAADSKKPGTKGLKKQKPAAKKEPAKKRTGIGKDSKKKIPADKKAAVLLEKAVNEVKALANLKPLTKGEVAVKVKRINTANKVNFVVTESGDAWIITLKGKTNNKKTPLPVKVQKAKPIPKDAKPAKGKSKDKKPGSSWLNDRQSTKTKDGIEHTLYFTGTEGNAALMIATTPMTLSDYMERIKADNQVSDADLKPCMQIVEKIEKKEKEKTNDDAKREQQLKDIKDLLFELGNELKKLKLNHYEKNTEPVYGSLHEGFGTSVMVGYRALTFAKGSEPSVGNEGNFSKINIRKNGGGSYYVKGHLLNDNLGGPGNTWENLTPINRDANKEHQLKFEDKVKEAVNGSANRGLDTAKLKKQGYMKVFHVSVLLEGKIPKALEILRDENREDEISKIPGWKETYDQDAVRELLEAERHVPIMLKCLAIVKGASETNERQVTHGVRNDIQHGDITQYQIGQGTSKLVKLSQADCFNEHARNDNERAAPYENKLNISTETAIRIYNTLADKGQITKTKTEIGTTFTALMKLNKGLNIQSGVVDMARRKIAKDLMAAEKK